MSDKIDGIMKQINPCCEWCSEPLDAAGECPNEMCESNMPWTGEDEDMQVSDSDIDWDWSDE